MSSSQLNLAMQVGISKDDGLLVAYLPPLDDLKEYEHSSTSTVVAQDGVVIDVLPQFRAHTKWWLVRQAARNLKLSIVEPIWQGAAMDFNVHYLPDVPRPTSKHKLHMRAYSHGPWIDIDAELNKE